MCFALGVPTILRFTRKCLLDNSCPDTKCSLLHGFALLAVRGEVILTPSPLLQTLESVLHPLCTSGSLGVLVKKTAFWTLPN